MDRTARTTRLATFVAPLLLATLLGASHARAQDAHPAESLYQSVCRNCHGPTAKGMASFPRLSDKDAAYLVQRLEQYRAGEKVGPNSALMMPAAADLSDDDIAQLADYITTAFE